MKLIKMNENKLQEFLNCYVYICKQKREKTKTWSRLEMR